MTTLILVAKYLVIERNTKCVTLKLSEHVNEMNLDKYDQKCRTEEETRNNERVETVQVTKRSKRETKLLKIFDNY